MQTKDICLVTLSKKECFDLFNTICLNILSKSTPSITIGITAVQIKLEKSDTTFRLRFECEVNSMVNADIQKSIKISLCFEPNAVIEKIIERVLEQKKIIRSANLNTPSKDLTFDLGALNGDVLPNKKAISFNFSLQYEDASDFA